MNSGMAIFGQNYRIQNNSTGKIFHYPHLYSDYLIFDYSYFTLKLKTIKDKWFYSTSIQWFTLFFSKRMTTTISVSFYKTSIQTKAFILGIFYEWEKCWIEIRHTRDIAANLTTRNHFKIYIHQKDRKVYLRLSFLIQFIGINS